MGLSKGGGVLSLQYHNRWEQHMIIFDLRLGRFSILALKEPDMRLGVQREGVGEVALDLPYVSLVFTDHSKATVQ